MAARPRSKIIELSLRYMASQHCIVIQGVDFGGFSVFEIDSFIARPENMPYELPPQQSFISALTAHSLMYGLADHLLTNNIQVFYMDDLQEFLHRIGTRISFVLPPPPRREEGPLVLSRTGLLMGRPDRIISHAGEENSGCSGCPECT